MDYSLYVSTPANTSEDEALLTPLKLSKGEVYGGWLYFPYGPAGYLHAQIWAGDIQLAPFNRGASFNLDDAVIPLSIKITLDTPPYELSLKTWNISSANAHALNIGLWLKPTITQGNYTLKSALDDKIASMILDVKAAKG